MHYISNTEKQKEDMLKLINVDNVNDLFKGIPSKLILNNKLKLPDALSELEVRRLMENIASKNKSGMISFLGAGAYNHFIPSVVNHMILRGEFFTAYTPYQPEISQGMLQAIFEFQTMICKLTEMDVANASMYDNSSAIAEAVLMASKIKRKDKILISRAVHPEHREVVRTYADANSLKLVDIDFKNGITGISDINNNLHDDFAAIVIQNPNFFGCIEDLRKISNFAHENGALFIVSVNEPTSLGVLKAPGTFGADIVVGEGQSFGNPISFGGPYVGFMATKKEYMRQIPGRLAGETIDGQGRRGFVLTLQAREQHIRRGKASSNICTNEALNALAATISLSTIGKGLKDMAMQNLQKSHYASRILQESGIELLYDAPFYNEFAVKIDDLKTINKRLIKKSILPSLELRHYYPEIEESMLICVTEMHTKDDIDKLVDVIK